MSYTVNSYKPTERGVPQHRKPTRKETAKALSVFGGILLVNLALWSLFLFIAFGIFKLVFG